MPVSKAATTILGYHNLSNFYGLFFAIQEMGMNSTEIAALPPFPADIAMITRVASTGVSMK